MNQLRVMQVGLGDWGRDWAQRVIPEITEIDLVGYVDPDPSALARLRDAMPKAHVQSFSTLEQGIEASKPEAVLVTATLPGHAPLAAAALAAGLHVLVEKPFAESLEAGQQLGEMAATRRKVLMVSQNYRFYPAVRRVAQLVNEARLGKLHEVSIDFRRYSPGTGNGRGRHHYESQPLLVDMSVHHFDLLRLILDREPERIFCEAWNPGWTGFSGPSVAVASIQFEGGIVVSYRGSWVSTGPVTPWSGEWRMDFEEGQIFWTSRDDDGVRRDRVAIHRPARRPNLVPLPALPRPDPSGILTAFARAIHEG